MIEALLLKIAACYGLRD